jgi:HAD superfamily hydrolase (TIGR01509 family)
MHPYARRVQIDAVIFDHDGTLVDSETITLTLLAEMAVEAGAEVYEGDIDRFKGADIKVVFAEIERRRRAPLPADFLDTFRSRQKSRILAGLEAIPGADEVLTALNVPTAVASNAPVAKMQLCLGATGLDRHFTDEELVSAYDVGQWKPAPDVFLAAASVLRTAPDRCAVVEDSVPGIEGAIAAGMQVFALDVANSLREISGVTTIRALPELLTHI